MNTPNATLDEVAAVVAQRSSGKRTASPVSPKEHGAWGQTIVPLVVGLALGTPGLAALAIAIAAILLFLAHEPLVLLLGQRGTRQLRERSRLARWWLGGLVLASLSIGGLGALAVNWQVRLACIGCITLAGVVFGAFVLRGNERSAIGEVSVAIALPSALVPVAMASHVAATTALVCWASLSFAYVAGVFGVRGLISVRRTGTLTTGWFGLVLTLLAIAGLAAFSVASSLAAVAFWGTVGIVRGINPSPKYLRRVGWVLVGANLVQALVLLVAQR